MFDFGKFSSETVKLLLVLAQLCLGTLQLDLCLFQNVKITQKRQKSQLTVFLPIAEPEKTKMISVLVLTQQQDKF